MISAPNTCQSRFNVFWESICVSCKCHWGLETGWTWLRAAVCQTLVGCSHVLCVCVCLHNCVHSSSQLCAYCAGLSVYGCTFLNYISATKLPSFPGILPSSGAASRLSQHAWVEKAACVVLFQTSYWNSTALIELLALDLSAFRQDSRGQGSKETAVKEKTNLKNLSGININERRGISHLQPCLLVHDDRFLWYQTKNHRVWINPPVY